MLASCSAIQGVKIKNGKREEKYKVKERGIREKVDKTIYAGTHTANFLKVH